MERNYRELRMYDVIESGSAWSVIVVDKDDENFLICEFDKRIDAERRAQSLNRKIRVHNDTAGSSQSD